MSQAYSRKDDIHFDLSILHTVLQIKILKCLLKRLREKYNTCTGILSLC